jgi:hypothetical protein
VVSLISLSRAWSISQEEVPLDQGQVRVGVSRPRIWTGFYLTPNLVFTDSSVLSFLSKSSSEVCSAKDRCFRGAEVSRDC